MRVDVTAATAMLGLPGFRLLAVSEYAGECEQAVETVEVEAFCRGCGARARPHGRRPVWVRDLPAGGRPVTIVWVKRVWRCREAGCAVSSWTETAEAIGARMSMTERARAEACRRVGQDDDSVAEVARSFGVGWATAMSCVVDHGTPRVDDPDRLAGVAALGVDETSFLAANATHHTMFVTGFVDIGSGRLLDVVQNRCGASVSGWLAAQPRQWRDGIDVLALDPHRGYYNGLRDGFADRAGRGLTAPVMVVDHFHAVKLANTAIDDVRRRVQQETLGHRGRTGDPLYGIRRVLLRGHERLTARAWSGSWPVSTPATPASRSPTPGSARRNCGASMPHTTWPTPAAGSPTSTCTARSARQLNFSGWPAPSPGGRLRSWPTSPPAAPQTGEPRRPTSW